MKIYTDTGLRGFTPWSGAVSTYNRLSNADALDDLEAVLEDCYPDGMTDTQLNDLLWFDSEWCYQAVGIKTESEIANEIDSIREDIDELEFQIQDLGEQLVNEEITEEEYEEAVAEIKEEIESKEEEIEALEEQM